MQAGASSSSIWEWGTELASCGDVLTSYHQLAISLSLWCLLGLQG